MNNKMKFWVIIPVLAIVLLLGGTYAWYVWQTSSDEETIIATDVGYAKVFFDGGSNINGKLKPVSDKTKGMSKEITVVADKQFIEPISFNLYLDINSIDAGLKHESFKFELYKDGNLVKEGNFSDAYLTEKLEVCETNTGKTHIILASDVVTTTESVYTLYTWIDGNMNNPLTMESQNFDFTLHASGEHAILGEKEEEEEVIEGIIHNDIIPEGGTYIRGAIPGTPNNHDMTNAITYTAGESFPGEPQKGDIYQYGDYEYVYGYYLKSTYYNLDSSLIGINYSYDNTMVSSVLSTTQYNENDNQNNVQFIRVEYGYRMEWFSAEDYFEDTDGWGVALIDGDKYIAASIDFYEIISVINNGKIINVSGLFADIGGNLMSTDSRINIPSTVKYMNYSFAHSWDWDTSDSNILKINSKNVNRIEKIFYDPRSRFSIIEVPEGSLTYDTFMAAKANGEIPEDITITTFVKE